MPERWDFANDPKTCRDPKDHVLILILQFRCIETYLARYCGERRTDDDNAVNTYRNRIPRFRAGTSE
jgi:hypothetical protein